MIAERARDLERASRTDRSVLDRSELLAMLASDDWTVRMHLCRMLTRVDWTPQEYPEVRDFAFREAGCDNTFVEAWALDALATFAISDEALRPRVLELLGAAIEGGRPSVKVRAREGLKRLLNGCG